MKTNQKELNNVRRLPILLSLLVVVGLLALTACEQRKPTAENVKPASAYTLVSVDGKPVPCSIEHEGTKLAVRSGTFLITDDGTCVSKVLFSPPSGQEVTREVKASYTLQGQTLTMKWEGAGVTTGTVQGDDFTMNNEGMNFAYRREKGQ